MSEPDHVAETRRWMRYSEEDLEAAIAMLGDESFAPRQICWFAQQSAEKALKAILVFARIDIPRHHDLERLRNLVPADWVIRRASLALPELSAWAVESRYPGDTPEATDADAQLAVDQARHVQDIALTNLRERGYPDE